MSLQVWLPLNADLENQGLGKITVTSGNPTYKDGKVTSKSLNLNQRIYFTCPQLANLQTFSVCFWGMTENSSTLTTNWQDLIGFTDVSSSGTNGTFRWETCYGYTGTDYISIHWHDNTTNALVNGSARHNCLRNEWCHCCVVFDAEKSKIYTYTNGILTATHDHMGGYFNSEGKFYLGETNNIEGRIQDVRFYNHALSKKEVKEISKGLCLHYQLKGPGGENLLTGYDTSFSTIAEGNSSIFFNQTNGGTQEVIKNLDGKSCVKIHTLGGNSRVYNTISTSINKTYTISLDYYATYAKKGALRIERNGGDYSWTALATDYTTPNEWQRLSITFTNTSNTTLFYFIYGNTNTDYYFTNIKLEIGPVATQWTPNSSDILYTTLGYNNNIEYDCSGYRRNGTKSGTITWDIDSPRYITSYKFAAGSKISASSGFPTGTNPQFTINFWFNPPSNFTYTSYADVCGLHCTTTGYSDTWCRLEACGSPAGSDWSWFRGFQPTGSNLPVENITQDAWNMITLVSDGTKMYTYTNGVNTRIMNITEWQPNGDFILGDGAGGISGKYSDLRIYATALSAEDIAELYHSAVIVDNTGKNYAYEYFEA